jgi:hypothetical protein
MAYRRNPHKYNYQRRRGDHWDRFPQSYATWSPGHSGKGTWPRYRTQRARVPTRSRHRRSW